jgi:hypothetical protein
MNRICWRLARAISRALEPDERSAVLGDLAESGETGGRAVAGVLGLLVRRQAALWKHSGPWVAPIALLAPVALLDGWSGLRLIGWIGPKVVTFWNVGVRYETGMTAIDDIVRLVCTVLLVIGWTWSGGFLLGVLARRAVWVHPVLLVILFWFSYIAVRLLSAPPVAIAWHIIWMLLIPPPFLRGVWRGAGSRTFGMGRAAWMSGTLAILTVVVQIEDARQKLAPHLLPFAAILWQFGLLYAACWGRRSHSRSTVK